MSQAFLSSLDTSARRAGLPSRSFSSAASISLRFSWDSLSPPLARFSIWTRRRSRLSRSASISSVSMISRSEIGSMRFSTWVMSSSTKQRATKAMASQSRMLARNWLPRPSPLDAPRTRPATSTKVIRAGMISLDPAMPARTFRRGSGTATSPVFGSMVQNG